MELPETEKGSKADKRPLEDNSDCLDVSPPKLLTTPRRSRSRPDNVSTQPEEEIMEDNIATEPNEEMVEVVYNATIQSHGEITKEGVYKASSQPSKEVEEVVNNIATQSDRSSNSDEIKKGATDVGINQEVSATKEAAKIPVEEAPAQLSRPTDISSEATERTSNNLKQLTKTIEVQDPTILQEGVEEDKTSASTDDCNTQFNKPATEETKETALGQLKEPTEKVAITTELKKTKEGITDMETDTGTIPAEATKTPIIQVTEVPSVVASPLHSTRSCSETLTTPVSRRSARLGSSNLLTPSAQTGSSDSPSCKNSPVTRSARKPLNNQIPGKISPVIRSAGRALNNPNNDSPMTRSAHKTVSNHTPSAKENSKATPSRTNSPMTRSARKATSNATPDTQKTNKKDPSHKNSPMTRNASKATSNTNCTTQNNSKTSAPGNKVQATGRITKKVSSKQTLNSQTVNKGTPSNASDTKRNAKNASHSQTLGTQKSNIKNPPLAKKRLDCKGSSTNKLQPSKSKPQKMPAKDINSQSGNVDAVGTNSSLVDKERAKTLTSCEEAMVYEPIEDKPLEKKMKESEEMEITDPIKLSRELSPNISGEESGSSVKNDFKAEVDRVKRRRSTIGRGRREGQSFGGRQSMCATLPVLSLEDQVNNIDRRLPYASKLSQILEIVMRESCRRVEAGHPEDECLRDFRVDLLTHSEALAGNVAYNLSGRPLVLQPEDSLPPKKDAQSVNKIALYKKKIKDLEQEYKEWKVLMRERKIKCKAAEKECHEAKSGKMTMDEDQASSLTSVQRNILASRPNYQQYFKEALTAREKAVLMVNEIKDSTAAASTLITAAKLQAESTYAAIETMCQPMKTLPAKSIIALHIKTGNEQPLAMKAC